MIQVQKLSKAYGAQVLFVDISFSLNGGERLGLIGRNGHGKSTLFNIIAGTEDPDSGSIQKPADYKIGYLLQHIQFTKGSVIEEAYTALPALSEEVDNRYQAEAILLGLGFSKEDFEKNPKTLSGGFQVRLNLVKLLVSDPNLLLLDEPTNYLDIVSIRWLMRFLRSWKGELMLITHDSDFMDRVSTHCMAIHRNKIRKISGNTIKLREQIAQDEMVYEQTRRNEAKKREQVEVFIQRFRAKASKASSVQSKIKALKRAGELEKLQDVPTLDFCFTALPFSGKRLLEIQDISFAYKQESKLLIKDLSLVLRKQDRIGIIGKNGKGKSTLLKLLAKEISPLNGQINYSPNLELAYFGQMNIERLHPDYTIEDEILCSNPSLSRTRARGICGLMMFEGDMALKKIKVLSGGEKSRVLLGKLLSTPANLLLLDEPNNHLDIESTYSLLEAIKDFSGAVILVTHSEMLLREFAQKLIVFDNDQSFLFDGSYDDFLDRVGWQDEEALERSENKQEKTISKKEQRKKRAAIIAKRAEVLNPIKKQITATENKIIELEAKINEINEELIAAAKDGFGDEAAKASRLLHQYRAEIDEAFQGLENLSKELDLKSKEFENQLTMAKQEI